ncbi:MAG: chromosomal replication initiator protein DnaA [Synergistaceae bacterium]|jgi:chromosomal replication initiator protein|nr:chromosomal replication initiator protein DnaA [Synergistaceae bacterium]
MDKAAPNLPGGTAELWLKSCLPVEIENGRLVLNAANVFARDHIMKNFLGELNRAAESIDGLNSIRFETLDRPETPEDRNGDANEKEEAPEPGQRAGRAGRTPSASPIQKNGLNPNYEFSSFVVGKSNRLAHAASLAVAETPGEAYNPLFIWGGTGLGKTHLMHAICHHALEKRNGLKVAYVSSEKFLNEFIQSIQTKQTAAFKSRYRSVDVLLIDDIQFLGEKHSSQEEFFHTFNSLLEDRKQIVICSDRSPMQMNIDDRLRSRFNFGLVTDIQPPDFETRVAILQKKAERRSYDIPPEIIDFLAHRIPSNIRELEGALNRVISCSELSSEPITIENTGNWLKDVLRTDTRAPATISGIQNLVAEHFGINIEDLTSSKRTAEITQARHIAMYLCREVAGLGFQSIALAFKKKDHTTVLHAYNKVGKDLKNDISINNTSIREIVEKIKSKL